MQVSPGNRIVLRWILAPGISIFCQVISKVKQPVHVGLIKLRLISIWKISRNVGQVIINAITLGIDIKSVEIANALGFGEAFDGPESDMLELGSNTLPFRSDLVIPNNEEVVLAPADDEGF